MIPKNCLSCKRFVLCNDPKKGRGYICSKFVKQRVNGLDLSVEAPEARKMRVDPVLKEKDQLNLLASLAKVFSSNRRIPLDIKIDDSDLPEFANIYEFCYDKQGLDYNPFLMQMATAVHLFGEWCPPCSSKRFNDILSLPKRYPAKDLPERVQLLEYGVCPKCGKTKNELIESGELNNYHTFIGVIGQRAGKSSLSGSILAPYHLHKFLKLQKPVETFDLLRNTILVGTFVGLTYVKAVELIWTPFYNTINESPWFIEYHKLLDYYANKYGEKLYKINSTMLHYRARGLVCYPSGPSKRTLRGPTRFLSVIDELGWFPYGETDADEDRERQSAEGVYTALDNSLMTVRKSADKLRRMGYNNVPTAIMIGISSPSNARDKIMSLLKVHAKSKDVLTVKAATWDFSPLYDKEDFDNKYKENYMAAERDFGANPPLNTSPFLHMALDELSEKLVGPIRNRITYEYRDFSIRDTKNKRRSATITEIRVPQKIHRSIMALDAGWNKNSFSIVLGHADGTPESYKCILDTIIEIAPMDTETPLDHAKIAQEIVYPLIEQMNVGIVVADRWNSIKMLQDIEHEFDIRTEQYSIKYSDFEYVRSWLIDEKVVIPRPEMKLSEIISLGENSIKYPECFKYMPVSHLLYQMVTVQDSGRTIEKGYRLTDDIFRSVFLALIYLLDEKMVRDIFMSSTTRAPKSIGCVKGFRNMPIVNRKKNNVGIISSHFYSNMRRMR